MCNSKWEIVADPKAVNDVLEWAMSEGQVMDTNNRQTLPITWVGLHTDGEMYKLQCEGETYVFSKELVSLRPI